MQSFFVTDSEKNFIAPNNSKPKLLAVDSLFPLFSQFGQGYFSTDFFNKALVSVYFLRGGNIKGDVIKKVLSYAENIGQFTLKEDAGSERPKSIDPGSIVRLAYICGQEKRGPLLSSLQTLKIDGATTTLCQLPLFLTPSLRSVEISNVQKPFHENILVFLSSLADEAPLLTHLSFGSGCTPADWLPTWFKFGKLRHLDITDCMDLQSCDVLQTLGTLMELESLKLDVKWSTQYVGRSDRRMNPAIFGGDMKKDDAASTTSKPGFLTSWFINLKTLSVTSQLKIMDDLLSLIDSKNMQSISLDLIPEQGSLADKVISSLELFKQSTGKWANTLVNISLQLPEEKKKTAAAAAFPKLSSEDLEILLKPQNLEKLDISGIGLNFTPFDSLSSKKLTKLKELHLPLHKGSSYLTFESLRRVAETFPRLISFRCGIDLCSHVPQYSNTSAGNSNLLAHPLEILHVGKSNAVSNAFAMEEQRLLDIARHLNILFPNLKRIEVSKDESDFCRWESIDRMVKLCQSTRLDETCRPPSSQFCTI
ncbi:hypothetical protein JR316_0012922 [Psilocybe cubensis]|uniref:Uncharacterized protein n=2 Tax=Psilocybe cubensis TaxID=181762 RepID=A0ACB8GFZ0_PSICU|nr:hypothetical protein JR316_0012922 [Psilocybe cubensis]KAH9474463.1 hypothetical protein JR316_0012922 [Psilocybe cubensis]